MRLRYDVECPEFEKIVSLKFQDVMRFLHKSATKITHFDLIRNIEETQLTEKEQALVSRKSFLPVRYLPFNLSYFQLQNLFNKLAENKTIISINFTSTGIEHNREILRNFLINNKNIVKLCFQNNSNSIEDLIALEELVRILTELKHIRYLEFDFKEMIFAGESLNLAKQHCNNILQLLMSMNSLVDLTLHTPLCLNDKSELIKCLANSLKNNSKLKRLSIWNVEEQNSLLLLRDSLKYNLNLYHLNLGYIFMNANLRSKPSRPQLDFRTNEKIIYHDAIKDEILLLTRRNRLGETLHFKKVLNVFLLLNVSHELISHIPLEIIFEILSYIHPENYLYPETCNDSRDHTRFHKFGFIEAAYQPYLFEYELLSRPSEEDTYAEWLESGGLQNSTAPF